MISWVCSFVDLLRHYDCKTLDKKILQHSLGSTYATNSCLQRYYIVSNSAKFLIRALLGLKVENIQIGIRVLAEMNTHTHIREYTY